QRLIKSAVEVHTVRQSGQTVMLRHMVNALLVTTTLGDVGNGGHPAAVTHRTMRYLDNAVLAYFADNRAPVILIDQATMHAIAFLKQLVAEIGIGLDHQPQQVFKPRPRRQTGRL